jgi:hypothetical protein
MLKYGEVNPLNVHGLRRMEHCPPHFTQFVYELKAPEKNISDWIWSNLSGRFFVGEHAYTDQGRKVMGHKVAFEIAGEATYFAMMLDQFNQPN